MEISGGPDSARGPRVDVEWVRIISKYFGDTYYI